MSLFNRLDKKTQKSVEESNAPPLPEKIQKIVGPYTGQFEQPFVPQGWKVPMTFDINNKVYESEFSPIAANRYKHLYKVPWDAEKNEIDLNSTDRRFFPISQSEFMERSASGSIDWNNQIDAHRNYSLNTWGDSLSTNQALDYIKEHNLRYTSGKDSWEPIYDEAFQKYDQDVSRTNRLEKAKNTLFNRVKEGW